MIGPGKYHELCTLIREQSRATGCIVILLGGDKGSGFSAQFLNPNDASKLPAVLRHVADQIEEDATTTRQ